MVLRLSSVAGFAEPALPLIGHTQTQPQTLPRGDTHSTPFGVITSGHREIERVHPLVANCGLPYNPEVALDFFDCWWDFFVGAYFLC